MLSSKAVRPGDVIVVSGPIGDHGVTILLARGELDLKADLRSDTRSVLPFIEALLTAIGPGLRWMRDPTRGGVATVLNELARDARVSIHLQEERVPVREAVRGACELLGLDPLHIANEGQFIAVVGPESAERSIDVLREAGCPGAAIIGEVSQEPQATVLGTTAFGGTRVIDMLVGDPLPRIC
jgi:hydrogenase expression/formation protein HypE